MTYNKNDYPEKVNILVIRFTKEFDDFLVQLKCMSDSDKEHILDNIRWRMNNLPKHLEGL